MDEQQDTSTDELNLATGEDEIAATEQSDTNEQGTDSKDEQAADTLDLEESEKETPKEKGKAETAREQMATDWAKKVKGGIKSLDDIPANQSWLKPLVEAKLGVKAESNTDAVRKVLAEERAEETFKSLVAELNDMGLEKDKRVALEAKFKRFRTAGLSKVDALETAKEALGISPEEANLDAKRHAMRLRTPGNYRKGISNPSDLHDQKGYEEVVKTVPVEQRREYLKKLVK
jgi:hypothetical protein